MGRDEGGRRRRDAGVDDVGSLLRTMPRPGAPPRLYDNLMARIAEERNRAAALTGVDLPGRWLGTGAEHVWSDGGSDGHWIAAVWGVALAAGGLILLRHEGVVADLGTGLVTSVDVAAAVLRQSLAVALQQIVAAVPPGWMPLLTGIGWAAAGLAAAKAAVTIERVVASAQDRGG